MSFDSFAGAHVGGPQPRYQKKPASLGPQGQHGDIQDGLREAYFSLIMNTQEAIFPEFVEDLVLQTDTESERGRAAVLEFRDGEKPDIQTLDTLGLKAYLDNPANVLDSTNSHQHSRRRAFLLEDLGRSKVEILGSRLRVPPAFFGAHWKDPSLATRVADQDSLSHSHSKYFRVIVPQTHRISQENRERGYPLGLYKDPATNIQRFLQVLDKDRKFEVSYHQVSYWSTSQETGWTVLFLVDPVVTQASLASFYEQNRPYLLRLEHPDTGENGLPIRHPLSMEPLATDLHKSWQNIVPKSNTTALFDNIIFGYANISYSDTSKLRISTSVCRHLILSAWQTLFGSRRLEYDRLSDKLLAPTPPDGSHGWFYTWDLRWRTESFRRLLYQQLTVASMRSNIRGIMRVLDINSTAAVDSREAQDWQALLEAVSALNEIITTLITGYTQEVSIQENQISNYQARSVGRLTSLAMILVPFSITASVFSMNGEFSAGQQLFWVFWIIAIPVAIALFFGLFTRALDLFWNRTR